MLVGRRAIRRARRPATAATTVRWRRTQRRAPAAATTLGATAATTTLGATAATTLGATAATTLGATAAAALAFGGGLAWRAEAAAADEGARCRRRRGRRWLARLTAAAVAGMRMPPVVRGIVRGRTRSAYASGARAALPSHPARIISPPPPHRVREAGGGEAAGGPS